MKTGDRTETIYGRMIGVIELYCPKCGTFRRHRTTQRGPWILRCNNDKCLRHWAVGLAVHSVGSGPHGVPPDTIFPPPRRVLERWKHGENLNVLDVENLDIENS